MTERERQILKRYENSSYRSIYDCYSRPSEAKKKAYTDCLNDMLWYNGCDLKILSYNTFMFTCAYKIIAENGVILVVHTPTKREEILIELNRYMGTMDRWE